MVLIVAELEPEMIRELDEIEPELEDDKIELLFEMELRLERVLDFNSEGFEELKEDELFEEAEDAELKLDEVLDDIEFVLLETEVGLKVDSEETDPNIELDRLDADEALKLGPVEELEVNWVEERELG